MSRTVKGEEFKVGVGGVAGGSRRGEEKKKTTCVFFVGPLMMDTAATKLHVAKIHSLNTLPTSIVSCNFIFILWRVVISIVSRGQPSDSAAMLCQLSMAKIKSIFKIIQKK